MQIHELKISAGKKSKRVGRGGKRGTYSGRGMKGQKARAGFSQKATFEGGKTSLVQRTKKLRGFKSLNHSKIAVNLTKLQEKFQDGDVISRKTLTEKGIIKKKEDAKILSEGTLDKKFKIDGLAVSAQTRAKIEKAGGEILSEEQAEEPKKLKEAGQKTGADSKSETARKEQEKTPQTEEKKNKK
ncbi:MAG: 50S ribosomal protein L15 [Candidatus Moranbacteria bacterium]|nr:50S ribosomal protein L15 [Candidatus Moranbacteria bacterium]